MVYEGYRPVDPWSTRNYEHFIIRYLPEHQEDVEESISSADWVREKTRSKYPHELSMKVTITLCSDKDEVKRLSNGRSRALGNSRVNLTRADIFIVHPSWEGSWETYCELDHPFRRVLNHEYVHCPFWQDRFRAERYGGYKQNVLPSWFNQGLAEYISENNFPSWRSLVMESVNEGRFTIDNEYAWGFYILEYMYETFSQKSVLDLVRSTNPSFWGAVQTELGVSRQDFERRRNHYLQCIFSRVS